MDFIDRIKEVSKRIEKTKDQILTEEATKNAFILPFIQALGYDIFNPLEVIPEYIADVGIKKGEKVDYAIIKDGNPIILIECKCCGNNLTNHNSQLYRYFSVTKARFAILTDGILYKFFTDLEELNKMDSKPFLEINLLNLKNNLVPELKKFSKEAFNIDDIMSSAEELKYTKEIKNLIDQEFLNPSKNFIKYFTAQVHQKQINQNIIEKYTPLVKKAFNQFVNDKINERLESAIVKDNDNENKETVETNNTEIEIEVKDEIKTKVITTIEELEAFAIVKSLIRDNIDIERISYKDTTRYFAVILDNSIYKTFCRLYLNTKNKYIGIIDENKKENKLQINNLNDIYNHKETIKTAITFFDKT